MIEQLYAEYSQLHLVSALVGACWALLIVGLWWLVKIRRVLRSAAEEEEENQRELAEIRALEEEERQLNAEIQKLEEQERQEEQAQRALPHFPRRPARPPPWTHDPARRLEVVKDVDADADDLEWCYERPGQAWPRYREGGVKFLGPTSSLFHGVLSDAIADLEKHLEDKTGAAIMGIRLKFGVTEGSTGLGARMTLLVELRPHAEIAIEAEGPSTQEPTTLMDLINGLHARIDELTYLHRRTDD